MSTQAPAPERRPIPGFPGYEIDTDGTVYSLPRKVRHAFCWRPIKGRIVTPHRVKSGSLRVNLYRAGIGHTHHVNSLWLAAFPEMGAE